MPSTYFYTEQQVAGQELTFPYQGMAAELRLKSSPQITADFSAQAYTMYDVNAASTITCTLPPIVSDGVVIVITNVSGSLSPLNSLILNPSGKTINNVAGTTILDTASGSWQLVYVSTLNGWKLNAFGAGQGTGPALNIVNFTGNGVYTPSPGVKNIIVKLVGGGGGSGGLPATAANSHSSCGGGGNGAYVEAMLTSAQIGASQPITIGTGGAAGVPAISTGGNGGATTFGTLLTAGGGQGSSSSGVNSDISAGVPGTGGTFTINVGIDLGSTQGANGASIVMRMSGGNFAAISAGTDNGVTRQTNIGTGPNFSFVTPATGAANTGSGGGASTQSGGQNNKGGAAGGSGRCTIIEYF